MEVPAGPLAHGICPHLRHHDGRLRLRRISQRPADPVGLEIRKGKIEIEAQNFTHRRE